MGWTSSMPCHERGWRTGDGQPGGARLRGRIVAADQCRCAAGDASYRLLNRTVLNYMLEAVDRHRSLMFLPALSGYPYATLEYDRPPGAVGGASTGERLAKAVDLLFSTSARPLRIITLMSLGISVLSLCYALYSVLIYVVRDDIARGWTSLSLQISGLFFLVCIILAVMSEYLLQVLEATTHHPRYHIATQRHSATMDVARPRNVVESGKGK